MTGLLIASKGTLMLIYPLMHKSCVFHIIIFIENIKTKHIWVFLAIQKIEEHNCRQKKNRS